ncbi:MAG: hypothetical protein HY881_24455 [Deltaproteobacteria bacterium]|nr:hypothetical protein [Deltaproteobacteria bacterium]
MTYNFDPDRWYENELNFLEFRHRSGEITAPEFILSLEELDRRYKDMWNRLDGTYRLP